MTSRVFIDADCISAFLWVGTEHLLEKLYSGKIVIPQEVYDEINIPTIPHLKSRIDQLVAKGSAEIVSIDIGTEEYELYRNLTRNHDSNKVIGKGEADSISLAKKHNGILGSINLRDVQPYVEEFSLEHMTTGDILVEAFKAQFITEQEAIISGIICLKREGKLGRILFQTIFVEVFIKIDKNKFG
ncbi:Uncharacterised protein [Streptococcus pneumoniae]|nr:Uncharacterised protein [Streptococcus pneumoniae]COL41047.1 Uncharacterised protein [Streptococcus pneumoniae]COQ37074.1 Uncharacterised protein [Streptococcus pneumoniae]